MHEKRNARDGARGQGQCHDQYRQPRADYVHNDYIGTARAEL